VIPRDYITSWRAKVPWVQDFQVEQDLVISRALVEIFSKRELSAALAFRRGTVLHKLHINPPARYSEDIDLVQIHGRYRADAYGVARSSRFLARRPAVETERRPRYVRLPFRFGRMRRHCGFA